MGAYFGLACSWALAPYGSGTVIATKGGLTRQGPGKWAPVGRAEYLIQQVELSLPPALEQRLLQSAGEVQLPPENPFAYWQVPAEAIGQLAEFAPMDPQSVPVVVAQWFGNALQSLFAEHTPRGVPPLFW